MGKKHKSLFMFRLIEQLFPDDQNMPEAAPSLGAKEFVTWLVGLGVISILAGILCRMIGA